MIKYLKYILISIFIMFGMMGRVDAKVKKGFNDTYFSDKCTKDSCILLCAYDINKDENVYSSYIFASNSGIDIYISSLDDVFTISNSRVKISDSLYKNIYENKSCPDNSYINTTAIHEVYFGNSNEEIPKKFKNNTSEKVYDIHNNVNKYNYTDSNKNQINSVFDIISRSVKNQYEADKPECAKNGNCNILCGYTIYFNKKIENSYIYFYLNKLHTYSSITGEYQTDASVTNENAGTVSMNYDTYKKLIENNICPVYSYLNTGGVNELCFDQSENTYCTSKNKFFGSSVLVKTFDRTTPLEDDLKYSNSEQFSCAKESESYKYIAEGATKLGLTNYSACAYYVDRVIADIGNIPTDFNIIHLIIRGQHTEWSNNGYLIIYVNGNEKLQVYTNSIGYDYNGNRILNNTKILFTYGNFASNYITLGKKCPNVYATIQQEGSESNLYLKLNDQNGWSGNGDGVYLNYFTALSNKCIYEEGNGFDAETIKKADNHHKCSDLLGTDLTEKLDSYYLYVKIFVPIAIIVLGVLDFGKAILASNEEDMKKAQSKFFKRLLIGMVIFFVPTFVKTLLSIGNTVWTDVINSDICGIK